MSMQQPALDRISSLPDEVICHILSFLPTKVAVATSVLSKRWHPLWRSVPALDFSIQVISAADINFDDDLNFPLNADDLIHYFKFSEFVFSCLLMRDATQPIKKFRLICRYDNCNVNKWISIVLRCGGLEHLELDLDLCYLRSGSSPSLRLPVGILSCKTLVVLKLYAFFLTDISDVELPSLKILHFERLQFTDVRCFTKLLSGCPNLEDFKATEVLQRLESVVIDSDYQAEFSLPKLTHMKLSFDDDYRWQWLVELLQHCPNLQILEVGDKESWMLVDKIWEYPEFVPECVSLCLKECTMYKYGGLEGELRFAKYIMQNARVLQTMRIYNEDSESDSSPMLEMKKELLLSQMGSATCQLQFCP